MNPIRITLDPQSGGRRRTFKTIAGARLWAHDMVGETPNLFGDFPAGVVIGNGRALLIEGITLAELFPLKAFPDCFHISA